MSRKPNLKSVRLSDEVLNYVNNFPGNGFNEKFENLVMFCLKNAGKIDAEIKTLEKTRDAIRQDIAKLTKMDNNLVKIKSYIKYAADYCENTELPGQMEM